MEHIWIAGKRFLVINFLRSMHPEIILKEFIQRRHQFHKLQGQGLYLQEMTNKNRGTIPMPTFAGRSSTVSSSIPLDFPQNSMVGQQRQQISELQFDKFHSPESFLVWRIRFKNQVTTCSDFPSEAMLWIKEVEMVDSFKELKSSRRLLLFWTRSSRISN